MKRLPRRTPRWVVELLVEVELELRRHELPPDYHLMDVGPDREAAVDAERSDVNRRLRYALALDVPLDGDDETDGVT